MWFKRIRIFVDYFLAFIFIESQLWSNTVCQRFPGYNINTNTSVRVQRGLCVHVPCSFTVPRNVQLSIRTVGIWHNTNGPVVASRHDLQRSVNGRFLMTRNVARGDCSYYIEQPLPIDGGRYYFRFEDGALRFTYGDIQPHVDVTELTDKPTISSTRLVDGEEVTLTCTSPGRCRNITSYISWEGTMTGIREKIYNITYEDGSRTYHSNLTFTPRRSHNNSPLFCRVTFQHDLTTMEKQTLDVEYSPSINIIIEGIDTNVTTSVIVKDGDNITLRCIVDSNPNSSVTWYKKDTVIHQNVSDQTITLELINITQSDAGKYQCSAENEHGVTHRRMEIIYQSAFEASVLFNTAMVAAVSGVVFLLLIIVTGTLLFMFFRKKRQRNTDGNLEDKSMNDIDAIYCDPEFTVPEAHIPEKTIQIDFQSGDDSVYSCPDDIQYSCIEFSKLKPKVVPEDKETEYSEIKKTNRVKGITEETIAYPGNPIAVVWNCSILSSMDHRRALSLLIAVLLKGLQCNAAEYYLEIPQKLWAMKHSCVVIPCSYTYSNPKLSSRRILGIWYSGIDGDKYDKVFIRNNTPKNTASFIGDLGNGDCSIKIDNIQSENSKNYMFRVEMKHFKFSYKNVVRLNVLDDPPSPILVFPSQTISEATEVTLKCSTTYTCSFNVPDLVWSSHEGQVNVTHNYQGQGLWKVESKQVFQLSRNHDGITLSCHANYPSGAKSQVVKGNLSISYKPEILQKSQCKRNLSAIYCECSAIANPPAIITWHSTDINVTEMSGFSINSSSRGTKAVSRLKGTVMPPGGLWCKASNSEGSKDFHLPTAEKPDIFQKSQCKRKLSAIYCECAAIANPPAIITWHSTDINVTETSGFSINSSSHGSKTVSRLKGTVMPPGGLLCKASNTEGSMDLHLPTAVDWTKLILIGGGILAFLILCITGAVCAIRKCKYTKRRSREKETLKPNNYITDNTEYNIVGNTNYGKIRKCANRNPDHVFAAVSFENKTNIEDSEEIYVNVKEEEEEEEERIYTNC
ncbi:uncharacterized protein LOC142662675 [Rhinoderma darwinii]|uniref:uncharacterized protein LOC142662675 n=1 Tax=Rhinoderma darwinii TaxID=43563 RepID=UPI003F67356E